MERREREREKVGGGHLFFISPIAILKFSFRNKRIENRAGRHNGVITKHVNQGQFFVLLQGFVVVPFLFGFII